MNTEIQEMNSKLMQGLVTSLDSTTEFNQNDETLLELTAGIFRLIEDSGLSDAEKVMLAVNATNLLVIIGLINKEYENDPRYKPFNFSAGARKVTIDNQNAELLTVAKQSFRNENPNDPLEVEFSKDIKLIREFVFGFTEGIKIGAGAKVGFDIGLLNGEISVQAELNFEANQQIRETTESSDGIAMPIKVPPRSSVEASVIVTRDTFIGGFSVDLIPECTAQVIENKLYKDVFGEKRLKEIFQGIALVLEQEGTISANVGLSFDVVVREPVGLPDGQ